MLNRVIGANEMDEARRGERMGNAGINGASWGAATSAGGREAAVTEQGCEGIKR